MHTRVQFIVAIAAVLLASGSHAEEGPRATLGLSVTQYSEVAEAYTTPPPVIEEGVATFDVLPGGPAHSAGMQSTDIIIEIDSKTMTTVDDMRSWIASAKPGSRHRITVWQITEDGWRRKDVLVTLGKKGEGVDAYSDFKDPFKEQFVEQWAAHIRSVEKEIERTRQKARRARRSDRRQMYDKAKQLEADLEALRVNDPPYIGEMPRPFSVGGAGIYPYGFEVFQIIDKSTMLAEFGDELKGGQGVHFLTGLDTSTHTGGQRLTYEKPLMVTGTQMYTTAIGTTKTVFVLQPVTIDVFRK